MSADPITTAEAPAVLVLDDEPLVRMIARRFLESAGYRCIEADNVKVALELLGSGRVVAAMLDMRLPGGRTGLDVLAELRQIPRFEEVPVLIVTGSILSESEMAAIAKHKGFVFLKPEGFATIVQFLDQLTGRDRTS